MRPFDEVLRQQEGDFVIGYHYPCPDGIYAALAAYLRLKQEGLLPRTRFAPLTVYQDNHPRDLSLQGNETFFLLDFTGGPGFAKLAAQYVRHVIVLDHHKTAQEELQFGSDPSPPNLEIMFDMQRSGAVIARDYFQPSLLLTPALARAYVHIQDQDLWRWEHPDSKAYGLGLVAQSLDFHANQHPEIFEKLAALDPDAVIAVGRERLEEERRLIAGALEGAFVVDPRGPKGEAILGVGVMLAVEVPSSMGALRSQLGNDLAELSIERGLASMGIVAYTEPGMEGDANSKLIKLSVRGKGQADTTALSKAFGGGGHALASSCIAERDVFDSWRVKD